MIDFPSNLILQNDKIMLRSITEHDFFELHRIAQDEFLWEYFTHDLSQIENYAPWAQDHFEGKMLQFVAVDKSNGRLLGSTGFGNYSKRDKRVEIGWTWYGADFHGKGFNTMGKSLMLDYAFGELDLERVEFKTDVLNLPARNALKRLGAKEDGLLRSHTLLHHGRRRDTIFYSFLKEEWPIKQD